MCVATATTTSPTKTTTTSSSASCESPRSTILPHGTDDIDHVDGGSNDHKMSQLWRELADRRVCINLRERPDRLQQVQKRFAAVGLSENMVQYHRPERHPRGGRYGCYSSHRDCIRAAYEDGLNSVLIFEDDVVFGDGWQKVVQDAHAFVHSKPNEELPFDALFLGSKILFVDEMSEKGVPDTIWRVKCFEAHAYIVSRQGMKKYLDGSDVFERLIVDHGQDLIHNSLWTRMYAHCHTAAIVQDDALGTDHIWIPELPPEYAEWMQFTVSPAHKRVIQPLVRSRLWQRSYLGRNYIFGIDNYVIDDGRLRLKGLWLADAVLYWLLMNVFCEPPPQGRWAILKAGVSAMVEHWPRRFRESGCCVGAAKRLPSFLTGGGSTTAKQS